MTLSGGLVNSATATSETALTASLTLSGSPGTRTLSVTTPAGTSNTINFTVTADPNLLQLSVNKAGTGSGAITSSIAGINCGDTCSASFTTGASVTLSAVPSSGSVFFGWGGP